MACKKRKAFTLTELLVVVVIIGVLSAVVLPKFTRVIEARKTTEAEEMMAAIRTEQEARCTISKNYQRELNKLASYRAGKNFTYEDLNGVGMVAKAVSGKYTLKMPSYADGRICCAQDDTYCQNLNKNYPKCNELTNFVEGNEGCSISDSCPEDYKVQCDPNDAGKGYIYYTYDELCHPVEQSRDCKDTPCPEDYKVQCDPNDAGKGYIYYTYDESCNPVEQSRDCKDCTPGQTNQNVCNVCGKETQVCKEDGTWGEWSECSVKDQTECFTSGCEEPAPATTQSCGCTGTQQRKVDCLEKVEENGTTIWQWVTSMWGECKGDDATKCDICPGIPVANRQCIPGEFKKDGTNMCSLPKETGGRERIIEMKDVEVETSEPELITNDNDSEKYPRIHQEKEYEMVDLGYYCSNDCTWKAFTCSHHGSGGWNHESISESSDYTIVSTDSLCTVHVHEDSTTGERWASGSCY